ncbi:hypothetical protein [Streptomyces sp. CBMA152]|uniref:hypothetical protein n=1 Tax=Streptomyces sp. CBMA152 TaxID=1896312 RepID=UPI00166103C2|nr:hypothetical protein [Streptomyces sp. CBMA152]MBD0743815.1 hypothetical protein [Streptomyces sp. CBMA152]
MNPSQSTRRTIRTLFQTALSLAAALPLIIDASGIPQTTAGVAVALAIADGLTLIMALPVVENLLPGWLSTAPDADDELLALDRDRGAK